MSQTLDNGATVPINSDGYNLTGDLATMGNSLTIITNVQTQTQRDALTKYTGRTVRRLDITGLPLEVWDGTRWDGQAHHAEFTASISVPTGTLYGPGTFTLDTSAASQNSWIASPGAADFLTVNATGLYNIGLQVGLSSAAAGASMSMRDSTGSTVWSSTAISAGATDAGLPSRNIYLTSGTTFRFRFFHTASTAQTWTSRAWVTKLG